MTEVQTLGIKVDASGIDAATESLRKFSDAADRAKAAIDSLNGAAHGGISIKIAGELATVEIKPVAS